MRKISLILLAAGSSRRFSQGQFKEGELSQAMTQTDNKLLYELDGKPLYMYTKELTEAVSARLKMNVPAIETELIFVTKPGMIQKMMHTDSHWQVLSNEESELGISTSVGLGITHATGSDYMFFVCDQPWLTVDTVCALIDGYLSSGKGIGCLVDRERFGSPSIFRESYRDDLLHLQGDCGGRQIRNQNLKDCYTFQVKNKAELKDIDWKYDIFPDDK